MTLRRPISVDKLEGYTLPVLFTSSGDSNIWHVPQVQDGEVQYLCGSYKGRSRMLVREKSSYQRRRNPRMCEKCQERAGTDGYPGAGVLE